MKKWWLFILLVSVLFVASACGGSREEEISQYNEEGQRLCPFTLGVEIRDHLENVVFSRSYATTVAVFEGETEYGGSYPNAYRIENISNIEEIRTEIDGVRDQLNTIYALFVGSSDRFTYGVPPLPESYRMSVLYRNSLLRSVGCLDEYIYTHHTFVLHVQNQSAHPADGYFSNERHITHVGNPFLFSTVDQYFDYWDGILNEGEVLNPAYTVEYSVGGSLTYVTVTSPGQSILTYSFDSQALSAALTAFANGEEYQLPKVALPEPSESDGFSDAIREDALGGIANGDEVLTFSFVAADLEGRQELEPFLLTGLNVATATSIRIQGGSAAIVVRGYDVTGQITTSRVSLEHSSSGGIFYSRSDMEYSETTNSRPALLVSGSFWVVSQEE